MQPWLIERVWKGKLGKITFACTAVHQCQSKADISLRHSLLPVSSCAHCFSEGLYGLYRERPRDYYVCPRVWLENVTEQAPALAGQSNTFLSIPAPPSSLFFDWASNKSDWSCLLCKQMKGWGDTKGRAEASNWKLMRKEEGARLTPLGRSKLPVWLRHTFNFKNCISNY